ncbi:hypothetical protein H4R99_008302, partial [Coemansia sp. RSA 1722]
MLALLVVTAGAGAAAAAAATIPLTQRTVDLIKRLEGFVAQPSPDPVGLPTVGYGH